MANFLHLVDKERTLVYDQQVTLWKQIYGDGAAWLSATRQALEGDFKRFVCLLPLSFALA